MPPEPRSESELIAAANRGDERAMEEIYLRYRDWSLRLAWRFTHDHDLSLDVVQEAFIYLYRKFAQPDGLVMRARLTTLLYPAIRNIALAARRKHRPRPFAANNEGESAEEAIPAAPESALTDDDRTELARLLSTLSDGHREVLLMKVLDGMEHAEIALVLGIPEGTVKSRLHHALAALRRDTAARERLL